MYAFLCKISSQELIPLPFCFALDLSELGHSCKLSCELSARVKPTLSDVKMALIDMGTYLYGNGIQLTVIFAYNRSGPFFPILQHLQSNLC